MRISAVMTVPSAAYTARYGLKAHPADQINELTSPQNLCRSAASSSGRCAENYTSTKIICEPSKTRARDNKPQREAT